MKTERGFTLVEILVTIVLIGVTTAALSSMFISIRTIQHQISYHDIATRAATQEIESLRNDSYDSLVDGSTINFTSSIPTTLPSANGTAAISSPSTDIRRIDATVTYKSLGRTKTIVVSSLIGEIGITQ